MSFNFTVNFKGNIDQFLLLNYPTLFKICNICELQDITFIQFIQRVQLCGHDNSYILTNIDNRTTKRQYLVNCILSTRYQITLRVIANRKSLLRDVTGYWILIGSRLSLNLVDMNYHAWLQPVAHKHTGFIEMNLIFMHSKQIIKSTKHIP